MAPKDSDSGPAPRWLQERLSAESNESLGLLRNPESNPICDLDFDPEIPCICVVWKRYATSLQLRFVHEQILHKLKKYQCHAILGNDTALQTIHAEDQRWIVEDWMPRAVASGLKWIASKRPSSHFGRIAVDSVRAIAPPGLDLCSFGELEDARHWLNAASSPVLGGVGSDEG